jgi:16S rRNA (guanine527-N7)-methyltransferase
MSASANQLAEFEATLLARAPDFDISLSAAELRQLTVYYQLISRWNPRLHLVAPCSAQEFAQRHILESLMLLRYLPSAAKVADIGSGAGLPVIPCLIARTDISATLIESAKRKAVFLREALKLIDRADSATVIAERFETIATPPAEFITSRALDRFGAMLPKLIDWAPPQCKLLVFGASELRNVLKVLGLEPEEVLIPHSERRFLFVVELKGNANC